MSALSLSHDYSGFIKVMDEVPCSPDVEKAVIHIENDVGQKIASDVRTTVGITGTKIGEVKFASLWNAYKRTRRLMQFCGDREG